MNGLVLTKFLFGIYDSSLSKQLRSAVFFLNTIEILPQVISGPPWIVYVVIIILKFIFTFTTCFLKKERARNTSHFVIWPNNNHTHIQIPVPHPLQKPYGGPFLIRNDQISQFFSSTAFLFPGFWVKIKYNKPNDWLDYSWSSHPHITANYSSWRRSCLKMSI